MYDLTERQHIEIQRRRNDLPALLAYLSEARLFFCVNHIFSALTGKRDLDDFNWFEEYFPAFEVQNGQMWPFHNREARQLAERLGKAGVGGSDAHVVASAGSAFTEVPQARNAEEFFRGLRAGRGMAAGEHGGYLRLTRDIFFIAGSMMRETPLTAFLAPLVPVIPLATLAATIGEVKFARRWSRHLRPELSRRLWAERFPFTNLTAERFA